MFKIINCKRIKQLDRITTSSGKRFENIVKNLLKELHPQELIIRGDFKNGMPDFLGIKDGEIEGLECKNYTTCKTVEEALNVWIKKQPRQYESFKKLTKHFPIVFAIKIEEGVYRVEVDFE